MKRWFRPVAYSIIAVLGALAIFGKPAAETPHQAVVLPTRSVARAKSPAHVRTTPVSVLQPRGKDAMLATLFEGVARTAAEAAPAAPASAAPPPPPLPELKVLGWMQSDDVPTIFVQFGDDDYTLTPSQSVSGTYRFDKIGGGEAVFTYLPTGETRKYAVSDPALSE